MISKRNEQAIINHAKKAYPHECCGFLLQQGKKQVYKRCKNVADNPAETFEIAAADWAFEGELLAIVHSHPNGEPYLSGADRLAMQQFAVPWALCVGGVVKLYRYMQLLRGRVFEYGKADCMTLIRDAYHLAGIELPDPVRGDMDEDAANNRFITEGVQHGFNRVYEPQAGDVILTALMGNANHAALYLGDGQMLHHAYGQLSRRDMYSQFWQDHTHSIWRHKDWQEGMIEAVLNDCGAGT